MLNLFQHPAAGDGIPKPIRQAQGVSEIESRVRDDNKGKKK